MNFVGSLHNHTDFSNLRLRDCIIKTEDLIDTALSLGHSVLAITDHEAISNAIKAQKYYQKKKKDNPDFKLILGNEIYLCRNGLNAQNYNRENDRYYHFVLLAKDAEGHKQIREISTRAWMRSYMARGMRRVPTYYQDLYDIIGKNPGHVIGSTACLGGALGTQLLKFRKTGDETLYQKILIWCQRMKDLFGDNNFYLEMQPSHNKEQIYVNEMILKISEELSIPYIITTDSHYARPEDRAIHKAYLNSQNGDREVDDFYATTYMMTTEELEGYMTIGEEQLQIAYQNIQKIADSCEDYDLKKPLKIPQLKWKDEGSYTIDQREWWNKIPELANFWDSDYAGDRELADKIVLRMRGDEYLENQEVYDEVNECLRMTRVSSEKNKAHWSAYFLNLQQIIEECWAAGTLIGPSRGSGGGFILLYLLGITQINPLRETTKLFNWRFLNPDRVSVLDIDTDIEGGRRQQVLNHLRNVYGSDRVANVATFGTEKSKSAILTACRGLGIDNDIAQYIASMIPADRGQLRTLSQCFYGDEEKGFQPIPSFVSEMTDNYPEVWEVAKKIEGLVCRLGVHAGGVIFVDEPFTESTALMRAPKGEIITQFDLHDCEDVSLIKMDLLSVEALDKIHNCLDLLIEYGYIEPEATLKETYEKVIGIYNLERDEPKMWKMIWNHEIESLFQMEKQSGIQGIAIARPKSIDELAVLNSVIRLMAPEKGAEMPLNMWGRYREDINQWISEMRRYGLSEDEIKWLSNHSAITDGICESQEGLMSLVQEERLGGNTLGFADSARKALAKKIGELFVKCEAEFYENAEAKGCSMKLVRYVWDVLLRVQRGYSFCRAHTLAYSFIALQEMNLAYKFPIEFWNCACLISDSGGNGDPEEDDDVDEYVEDIVYSLDSESLDDFVEDEDDEEDEEEVEVGQKKKKKTSKVNYGKIATAIGKMTSQGIKITPPNINTSSVTFSPDIENHTIRFGLSGISQISKELIQTIIANRPYTSIEDFCSKVKITKPKLVNLIKAGAFDDFGDRIELMSNYIESIADVKKTLNLRNMQMLIKFNLLPESLDFEKRLFNFNKYVKKLKNDKYYDFDNIAFNFYEQHYDMDLLVVSETSESGFAILQTVWDRIYTKGMDPVRNYIKANLDTLLRDVNFTLFSEVWNKYATGSISKWEMDAVSCYFHEHELANINEYDYDFVDFNELPEEPYVATVINIKGKQVPLFKIERIMGTVLDRDKSKKTVTLLTKSGVVTVKIFGQVFANYDKQISVKGADGKKHVIEKSFFSRGNKIVVSGIRREDSFCAKKYSKTPWHLVELITKIDDEFGEIETRGVRAGEEEE